MRYTLLYANVSEADISSARSSSHTYKLCASCTRLTTPFKAGHSRLATSAARLSRRMLPCPASRARRESQGVRLWCVSLLTPAFLFALCADERLLRARSSGAGLGHHRGKGRHEAGRDWWDPQGAGMQRGTSVQFPDMVIDPDWFQPRHPQNTAIRRTMPMYT